MNRRQVKAVPSETYSERRNRRVIVKLRCYFAELVLWCTRETVDAVILTHRHTATQPQRLEDQGWSFKYHRLLSVLNSKSSLVTYRDRWYLKLYQAKEISEPWLVVCNHRTESGEEILCHWTSLARDHVDLNAG